MNLQQLEYFKIIAETKNVVTGRIIQRYNKPYPIASLPFVKNQNTIIAITQINRYDKIVMILFLLGLLFTTFVLSSR